MTIMTPERCQEIVDELRGTCKNMSEVLEPGEDDMDAGLTAAIDSELFLCDECGWWHECGEADEAASAASGNDICESCASAHAED